MANTATYRASAKQSIFDICLMTYGTSELLVKLMMDNNISDYNADYNQILFNFDPQLVSQGNRNTMNSNQGITYTTKYTVPAQADAFLLLETGGYILLETSAKILLEQSNH